MPRTRWVPKTNAGLEASAEWCIRTRASQTVTVNTCVKLNFYLVSPHGSNNLDNGCSNLTTNCSSDKYVKIFNYVIAMHRETHVEPMTAWSMHDSGKAMQLVFGCRCNALHIKTRITCCWKSHVTSHLIVFSAIKQNIILWYSKTDRQKDIQRFNTVIPKITYFQSLYYYQKQT